MSDYQFKTPISYKQYEGNEESDTESTASGHSEASSASAGKFYLIMCFTFYIISNKKYF